MIRASWTAVTYASQIGRIPGLQRADRAAVGYGGAMGCFAVMVTRTAA